MHVSCRSQLIALLALVAGALLAGPALAVEDGLMGVRVGASYRELTKRLGSPDGILLSAGGGMMYQTLARPAAGLPQFGGQASPTEMPVWVRPVLAGSLAQGQAEWFYDLRSRKGVALGIVLNGEGADAAVTDVVVAGFSRYLKGKPAPVRTERGIKLMSSFGDVLKEYGYPPLADIYAAGSGGAGGAMRAAGGAMGGGGGTGSREGGMGDVAAGTGNASGGREGGGDGCREERREVG